MRIVEQIAHPQCQITVYAWNGKYLLKFEQPMLEQTYKVSEMDLTGPDEVKSLLNEAFIARVLRRFDEMRADWQQNLSDVS
ncbi:hypothetical protein SAMN05421823_102201 [Catalinimonas alkaloidigena]|uniref:Uncharacterized protein n=1 Tax=Catalinimonas alkaloidigena TaxID=1075417 RepID=A0A1G9A758_9BACT|nr:hypothetical protein [Catalinimonas alkaloidigena]SDK23176.1 hypothetical protein SAMN05421823_102201 [Catalinimonas alkaloidigena]